MKHVPLTKKEKFAIVAGIGLLIIGYFAYQSFAGTTLGVTIKTSSTNGTSINDGLVGLWTFDSTNMTQNVGDSSGVGNTGRLVSFTSTTTVAGKIGQALKFNGSSNYVSLGNASNLQIGVGTLSAWIKTSGCTGDGAGYCGIIVKQNAYSMLLKNNVLEFFDWPFSSDRTTGVNMADNKWHHVVVTFNSGVAGGSKIYIDGALSISADFTVSNQTTEVEVGNGGPAQTQFFNGQIDDARIYNRILSAGEVARLYALGGGTHTGTSIQTNGTLPSAPNPNSGLVGYWTFDGPNMLQNVRDSSGQGNNGWLVGISSTTTVPGKIGGQAINFTQAPGGAAGVNIGQPAILTNIFNATSSVAFWFYSPVGVSQNTVPLSKYSNATGDGWNVGVNIGSSKYITFRYGFTNFAGAWQTPDPSNISPGTWNHVVVEYNNSLTTNAPVIFINGISQTITLLSTPVGTPTSDSGRNLFIGNLLNLNIGFKGYEDDVRIYNRALSAAEVQALYSQGGGVTSGASVQTNSNTGNSLSTGLVGYWTFDGKNMFQNVADSSGNGNDMLLRRLVDGATATTTIPGPMGQALQLNPSGASVANTMYTEQTSNAANLKISGSFTTSFWMKAANISFGGTMLSREDTQTGNCSFDLRVSNGVVAFRVSNTGTCVVGANAARRFGQTVIQPNKWYHVVSVYDASAQTMHIYLNGVLDDGTLSGTIPSSVYNSSLTKGLDLWLSPSDSSIFQGALDDVRVYNRALSAQEVARLYQLGK